MAFIAGVSLLSAVLWELRHPDPVIDFRLLRIRNFAIANGFYFLLGIGLFASSTIIPKLLQGLYGYRALDAGMVLGPGALVIAVLAPLGAQAVQRGWIYPRTLLFYAALIVGFAFLNYSHFTLNRLSAYAMSRAFQCLGYAFFFVPLSVIAYSQLSPGQNNRASLLTNFFRNWGGSFGIAMTTALSERRQDFHQARLGNALTPSLGYPQSTLAQTMSYLRTSGFSATEAANAAAANIYQRLHDQALMMAYMDCFHLIGVVTPIAAPAVFLCKSFRSGGKAPAAH